MSDRARAALKSLPARRIVASQAAARPAYAALGASIVRMSAPLVLVDARNVLRSVWPNLGEEEAARLACSWAEHGCRALVVFDRAAPDVRVGEHCTVIGSGAETADDLLTREAATLASRGEPYWLVTSDRALRAAAGGAAERAIGGGAFARELRSA